MELSKRGHFFIKNKNSIHCEKNKANLNIIDHDIKLISRIGTKSVDGEVFKACYPLNCENKIAIKRIKINLTNKPVKNFYDLKVLNSKDYIYVEIFFLELLSDLVKNKICPNLPMYFKHTICKDCPDIKLNYTTSNKIKGNSSSSKKTSSTKGKSCVYIANELATGGDLKKFLHESISFNELLSAYLQIFVALYSVKKQYNFQHLDLHWGNVLCHKLKNHSPSLFRYKLKSGKCLDIPVYDRLFVLWDFGRSSIPGKIIPYDYRDSDSYKKVDNSKDFKRIIIMLKRESHESISVLGKEQQQNRDLLYGYFTNILNVSKKSDSDFLDTFMSLLINHPFDKNEFKNYKVKYTFYPDKHFKSSNKFFNSLKLYKIT
jgi:hypothetical protein